MIDDLDLVYEAEVYFLGLIISIYFCKYMLETLYVSAGTRGEKTTVYHNNPGISCDVLKCNVLYFSFIYNTFSGFSDLNYSNDFAS